MPDTPFTTALARFRAAKGWTRAELARHAGLDAGTVGCYESGTKKPGLTALNAMADALGVSLDELTGRTTQER